MDKNKKESLLKTIKPGDLVFTRGESPIGKIIRWATESNLNHVAMYIGNGLLIEETLGFNVRILPIEVYANDKDTEIYLGRVKEPFDVDHLINYAKEFYGSRYDLIGLFGILAKCIVKKTGLEKLITFWGKNKIAGIGMWCSEYMGVVFISVNIKFADMDTSYLSPADIYNSEKVNHINY